ncbi:MAG: GNAT family N-acetyltransferase [Candidatus Pacearchaeota archaeon]
MHIKIRKAKKSDAKKIFYILRSNSYLKGRKNDNYSLEDVNYFMKKEKVYVFSERKKIKGFIGFELHGSYIYLKNIAVLSKYRGKGIGKHLLNFLENYAKKNKIGQIEMFVERKNNKMINFIEKRGYLKGKNFVYYMKKIK